MIGAQGIADTGRAAAGLWSSGLARFSSAVNALGGGDDDDDDEKEHDELRIRRERQRRLSSWSERL